jgi:predicted type IV restriction endonuclease
MASGLGDVAMNALNELRAGLCAVAKRSVGLMSACGNEESTKLYLVLPIVGLFGYDYTNPYEVYPQHAANADPSKPNKVDFAVLRDGQPVIAIQCKKVGTDLSDARSELRAYYNAVATTKLGILTNGIVFEFFVDSTEPNAMDEDPFLTLDLESVWRNGVPDEVLEALVNVTKESFDPESIAEMAHVRLVKKRLRTSLVEEANSPTEEFCRFFLQRAGLKHVRKGAIDRYYGPLIKTAFDEALVLPAMQRLRSDPDGKGSSLNLHQIGQRIVTSERELAIVNYIRRRLAYLVADETLFAAIDRVDFKDNVGKLVVFYGNERKGRMFDYIEGAEGFDKFIFPSPYGEIVTKSVIDIDEPLQATFTARVRELGHLQAVERLARIA